MCIYINKYICMIIVTIIIWSTMMVVLAIDYGIWWQMWSTTIFILWLSILTIIQCPFDSDYQVMIPINKNPINHPRKTIIDCLNIILYSFLTTLNINSDAWVNDATGQFNRRGVEVRPRWDVPPVWFAPQGLTWTLLHQPGDIMIYHISIHIHSYIHIY